MIKPYPKEKKLKAPRTLAKLKKDLDKVFNAYIRQRDTLENGMFKCISCGEFKDKSQMNAGHYYSAGHHSALRWVEENVNGQCVKCNCFLSGNLLGYEKGMIEKWGATTLRKLGQSKNNKSKMARFEIEFLIDHYKKLL